MDYIIRNTANVNFPGSLAFRGPDSRKGYPTMEAAERRLHEVNAHYNRVHGQGLPLVVEERREK